MKPTLTRIFLARHGGTTASAGNLFAGSIDPPLSDEGRAQVEALSRRLAGVDLAAAYCSGMKRTIETATIIGRPHAALAPIMQPALREISHGHWEGERHEVVEEKFADEYQKWAADPLHFAPAGGENGQAVLDRALPALKKIVADHAGKSVLVVSHTGTNRLLLCALLGIEPKFYRDRFAQDPACLNILDFKTADDAMLVLMNDISHYTTLNP